MRKFYLEGGLTPFKIIVLNLINSTFRLPACLPSPIHMFYLKGDPVLQTYELILCSLAFKNISLYEEKIAN